MADAQPISWREGLDLDAVGDTLWRRRRLVASIAAGCVLASGVYTLVSRPQWQGEFQIVLASSASSGGFAASILAQNPQLAAIANLTGGGTAVDSRQKTEIKILQSPSVLLPVYRYLKARKPTGQTRHWTITTWASRAVRVKAAKGTDVLQVRLRDSDRQLILPATQLLAEVYKRSGGRLRRRELDGLISYLNAQIQTLKPQTQASSQAALRFAERHQLELGDGLPISGAVKGSGVTGQVGSAEGRSSTLDANRAQLRRRLLELQVQLQQLRQAGSQSVYIAAGLPVRSELNAALDALATLETRLAERQSLLQPADPGVRQLQRERRALIGSINQQTENLLLGERAIAQANLQALQRPEAVLQRHRDLTQKALREEASLVELQNFLNAARIERARDTAPWELISEPIVPEQPVLPDWRLNLGAGVVLGVVLGLAGGLLADRLSPRVYARSQLQALLPYGLLAELDGQPGDRQAQLLRLLAQGPLAQATSVALVPVGQLGVDLEPLRHDLARALQPHNPAAQVLLGRDLSQLLGCQLQLLVTTPGAATRDELLQLQRDLVLQAVPVAGVLLLQPAPQLAHQSRPQLRAPWLNSAQ